MSSNLSEFTQAGASASIYGSADLSSRALGSILNSVPQGIDCGIGLFFISSLVGFVKRTFDLDENSKNSM